MKYLLPLASPASPLCPCNDPLLHPPLIYATSCVAISTHRRPPFTRTSLELAPILLIFPDYLQSFLISLSTERLRETSCHGSFAGNGNCNGAGMLRSGRKKVSFLHSVCEEYRLLRFTTSCRRAEICGRIFFLSLTNN